MNDKCLRDKIESLTPEIREILHRILDHLEDHTHWIDSETPNRTDRPNF